MMGYISLWNTQIYEESFVLISDHSSNSFSFGNARDSQVQLTAQNVSYSSQEHSIILSYLGKNICIYKMYIIITYYYT